MPISVTDRARKTFALWRGTDKDGERQAARAALEKMAAAAGATFDEFRKAEEAERIAASGSPFNIFDGFDDFCEAQEPGYKARRAMERAEKIAARAARRKALLERFGSEEAITSPCERERLIIEAVKPWRTVRQPPHERWTDALDGWSNPYSKPPAHIDAAIRGAYPLPTTFADARAEYDYWQARVQELADAWDRDCEGNELDLPAYWRAQIVERLIESELIPRTAADVLARFRLYRECEFHDHDVETRIFRDLERVVAEAAADVSMVDTLGSAILRSLKSKTCRTPAPVYRGQIEAAISADPARSDRSIAREFQCSPTTVGKIRASIGLGTVPRSVQRGGRTFEMRVAEGRRHG